MINQETESLRKRLLNCSYDYLTSLGLVVEDVTYMWTIDHNSDIPLSVEERQCFEHWVWMKLSHEQKEDYLVHKL